MAHLAFVGFAEADLGRDLVHGLGLVGFLDLIQETLGEALGQLGAP